MTATPTSEPTLATAIAKLDKLSTDVEKLSTDVDKLSTEVKKFDEKFSNYQQSIQWVVQLAFTLIASATITIIVSAVLRR